jgi:hypothetical protein
MAKKEEVSNVAKCLFVLSGFILIAFIAMGVMAATNPDNIIYAAIPTMIIGGGGFVVCFAIIYIQGYLEWKESVPFADLEDFKLPKFYVNERTSRLYQIYNY